METNELLQAISNIIDQKLEPINSRLDKMDDRFDKIESRLDKMDDRFDGVDSRLDRLEKQIKRTERTLKAEIVESENIILEEVSRVHHILNDHIADKNVHTA